MPGTGRAGVALRSDFHGRVLTDLVDVGAVREVQHGAKVGAAVEGWRGSLRTVAGGGAVVYA